MSQASRSMLEQKGYNVVYKIWDAWTCQTDNNEWLGDTKVLHLFNQKILYCIVCDMSYNLVSLAYILYHARYTPKRTQTSYERQKYCDEGYTPFCHLSDQKQRNRYSEVTHRWWDYQNHQKRSETNRWGDHQSHRLIRWASYRKRKERDTRSLSSRSNE